MSNVYKKLNFDLQSRVNQKIKNNIKTYFKKHISNYLIDNGKKNHIIRYIINYYLTSYNLYSFQNKHKILFMDLLNYLEDNLDKNELSQFLKGVFYSDDLSKIHYTFSQKQVINKILKNMSYDDLFIFKKKFCCIYFNHNNYLF